MKRNLDDQAKIFSLSFNKKDTSIFRVTTTFTEDINEKYLQQALDRSLKRFKEFKVKLEKTLFWYYLEDNHQEIPIHKKIDYTFTKINTKNNNDYLFRVAYEGKQLVLDFFHLLTDGSGAKEFLKELIYNYVRLNHPKLTPQEKPIVNSENAYTKYYTNKHNKAYSPPRSYQLKGEYIPSKEISFNDICIRLSELKKIAKSKECSLSVLLISLIVYSLYETNYKTNKGNKPINVCIPINLRKYFSTDTITNFVSHAMLSIEPNNINSLDEIIALVKQDFTSKIDEEKIKDTFESNGKSINNKLLNIIPLSIKRFIVILGSHIVKRTFTITFSNLGEIKLLEEYEKYVQDITFKLIPDWAERIRCGISSYQDTLTISFGSNLLDNSLELRFKEELQKLEISHITKDNNINPLK